MLERQKKTTFTTTVRLLNSQSRNRCAAGFILREGAILKRNWALYQTSFVFHAKLKKFLNFT
jgi:hypothetical protein